jgi:hypothetical protein
MSMVADQEKSGLKEPFRALLILLSGLLMALAAFAGQIDYPRDNQGKVRDSQLENRAGLVGSAASERG